LNPTKKQQQALNEMQSPYFLIVVGAGAAGIFAAVNAALLNPEKKILVLEKSDKLLSKVRISGGGRCNVTHACFEPAQLLPNYPRGRKELAGPFSRFHAKDTVEWFAARGVRLKTEADGRMFPVSDDSEEIIQCLLNECSRLGVIIKKQTGIKDLIFDDHGIGLLAENGGMLRAQNVLIATGGSPQKRHYEWLEKTGHTIKAPVPSLFTFNLNPHPLKNLMGLSVQNAVVSISGFKEKTKGPVLITHWGLSGPAILKMSALAALHLHDNHYKFDVAINWLPDFKVNQLEKILQEKKLNHALGKVIKSKPFPEIPIRFWEFICGLLDIPEQMNWADISHRNINRMVNLLHAFPFRAEGKTTFKEEFVTCGGLDLKQIDLKTMESKLHPGLFFAGELLNIDGITGGFNFQAAWTTGFIAASSLRPS
jgi:predicted Rossmann fold flavoprotein